MELQLYLVVDSNASADALSEALKRSADEAAAMVKGMMVFGGLRVDDTIPLDGCRHQVECIQSASLTRIE